MTQVFTIGYEGTDIDRFIATLKAVGVKQLADVRELPLSRKKGFSKTGLRARIEAAGIRYVHLPMLGDPKAGRLAARAGRFSEFRKIYGRHLASEEAQAGLKTLAKLTAERSTCLMCFERDPTECHRSIVASELKGIDILHLVADDPARYVRNAKKLPGGGDHQSATAA